MRAINVAIVRPAFLALIFGAPALGMAAAVVVPTPATVTAAALQVAGLVVTIAVNVPLNTALEQAAGRGSASSGRGRGRTACGRRRPCSARSSRPCESRRVSTGRARGATMSFVPEITLPEGTEKLRAQVRAFLDDERARGTVLGRPDSWFAGWDRGFSRAAGASTAGWA